MVALDPREEEAQKAMAVGGPVAGDPRVVEVGRQEVVALEKDQKAVAVQEEVARKVDLIHPALLEDPVEAVLCDEILRAPQAAPARDPCAA